MRSRWLAFALISALLPAQTWQIARPGYQYEFPRDHFSHPDYQTEWWYYTGNLKASNGHRYGFELTFFRQGTHLPPTVSAAEGPIWNPAQLYLAHLALSDVDGHSFHHAERLNRAGPGLAGADLSGAIYWNGNWQVRWTALPSTAMELVAVCDHFTLRLNMLPAKPPVIQGQNGISQKGPAVGQASHYISFTRIAARGTLQAKGKAEQVSGTAWMDHEFFTEPPASNLVGWDWFAIQLDNNEELMLYRLRDKSGEPDRYSSGSYVDGGGRMQFLWQQDFSLSPGDVWQSPHSRAKYPLEWKIVVPSLHAELLVRTDLKDQELANVGGGSSPSYWEGAVTYSGTIHDRLVKGVGYMEMTGYDRSIRLAGMAPEHP